MTRLQTFTVLLGLTACGPAVVLPAGEDDTSSSGSSSGEAPVATTLPDPPDLPPPGTTADPSGATTGGWDETTGGGTCGFLCDPTENPNPIECDLWEQDCPDGEKCSPWANDGGNSWNAAKCVPIDPNPDDVDEPCTVEGSGVSGIDSCVLGAMCWDVDPRTNAGTCVPLCIGGPDAPSCADSNRICALSGDGVLILCLALCDPLDPGTCPAGDGCYPYADVFVCAPDASGDQGAAFEPCEFTNACDPGLVCTDATDNPLCAGSNCCTPLCALSAPSCPEPLTCIPAYDEGTAPPLHEDLGVCVGD